MLGPVNSPVTADAQLFDELRVLLHPVPVVTRVARPLPALCTRTCQRRSA
jgi:hypothetical protein